MPHIDSDSRQWLDKEIDSVLEKLNDPSIPSDAKNGCINYVITRIVWEGTGLNKKEKYWKYSDAISCFECAKLELYRMCAKYEDKKIDEHGSAYQRR